MSIYKVKFRDEKWIPFLEMMGPLDNAIIKGTFLHQAVHNFSVHTEPVVSTIKFSPVNTRVNIDNKVKPNTVKLNVLPLRAANFDKVKVHSHDESIVTAAYDNVKGEVTLTPLKDGEAFVTAYVDDADVVYPEFGEYGTLNSDPNSVLRVNVYKGSMTTQAIRIEVKEDSSFNYQDGSFHIAKGVRVPVEELVTLKEFRELGAYDGEHIDANVEVLVSNNVLVKEVQYLDKKALHFSQNGEFVVTVRSKAFPDVTRKINVKVYNSVSDVPERLDAEGPVIEDGGDIPGEASFNQDLSIPVTLTAIDDVDGEIVAYRTILNSKGEVIDDINTSVPDTYTIKYIAEDSSGNTSELVYTLKVNEYVDDVNPTINYSGQNPIVLDYGAEFVLPKVTVSDNWDSTPSLTSVMKNDKGTTIQSIDTKVPGTYTINYTAKDSNNNTEELQINVVINEYVDNIKPTINYSGQNPIEVEYGGAFNMPNITVSDNWDGTPSLVTTIQDSGGSTIQSINTELPDTYTIKYTAKDSSNNTEELNISVVVKEYVDNIKPTIHYSGANPIEINFGETFNMPNVTVSDNWDESPSLVSVIQNDNGDTIQSIDTEVSGNYLIKYTAKDSSNNTEQLQIDVVVHEYIDDVNPVIEYNGADPIVLDYGTEFVVPEVTVSDNYDSTPTLTTEYRNSTGTIVDTVDTTVAGNYSVVFTASDDSGNKATLSIGVQVNEEPIPEPDPEPEEPVDPPIEE